MITYKGDELFYDGHAIAQLADRFPTPFFLFSERVLAANYNRLLEAFSSLPAGVVIDYCVKTNHEPALLGVLHDMGAGAMVSCGWELQLAVAAGFDPERITFHGPCKTRQELDAAVSAGVGLIHVYSEEELDQLSQIAAAYRRPVKIALRLPTPDPWWARGLAGWYAQRLGIPWHAAERAFQRACASAWLCPVGISVHVGTQVTRPDPYRRAIQQMVQLAEGLGKAGIVIREIGLGGGWPSDTLQPLTLKALVRDVDWRTSQFASPAPDSLARQVANAFRREVAQSRLLTAPRLRLEPGRGIVGSAGLLVTRVVTLRDRWVFVDGSRNVLPETLFPARRLILPVVWNARAKARRCHLAGRTLNTMDVLALGVRLPPVQLGDVLAFLDAGAYSLSRACHYAGTVPDVYLLKRTETVVHIREEDRYEHIVAPVVFPDQRAAVLE